VELSAGDRLGKYEIAGRIAAGGMAEVYLARSLMHGGFAKTVAIKRMLPGLAAEPGFREMFMQEASVASRLGHANIVQIFDFAEEQGELYLAMEFVHGVTLRKLNTDVLFRNPQAPTPVPPTLAAHICRGVARALAYAWQVPDDAGSPLQIVHRDVTPHNILLSYDGDVKLADFGIAKPVGRFTSVGVLKGKLLYMAPEQVLGGPLDARTDVFALGVVLYETAMSLRKPLFDAGTQDAVRAAVQSRMIPPPDRMDPDFPREISKVTMKALEREPARRYPSAAAFADALGEAIHKETRGPLDVDLAAFMRRVYGEPPPLKLFKAPAGEAAGRTLHPAAPEPFPSAQSGSASPPDPQAATVVGSHGQDRTRSDRGGSQPAPAQAEGNRKSSTSRRARSGAIAGGTFLLLLAAGAAFLVVGPQPATAPEPRSQPLAQPTRSIPDEEKGRSPTLAPAIVLPPSGGATAPDSQGPATPATTPVPVAPVKKAAPSDSSDDPSLAQRSAATAARPSVESAPAAGAAIPAAPVPASLARPVSSTAGQTVRAERPVATPSPSRAPGRLEVHITNGWAYVWVDRESFSSARREASPKVLIELSAGPHVVHLGDESGLKRDHSIVVQPGRTVRVRGSLAGALLTQ
jgi:serine/threonine-protein kinase